MGSRIAAHMANAGLPVVLLDIVPPGIDANAPTEGGAAWATVYRWLVGAQFDGCHAKAGVYSCTFTYANARGVAIWSPTRSIRQSVSQSRCVAKIDGTTTKVAAGSTITVGPSPVMIVGSAVGSSSVPKKAPC